MLDFIYPLLGVLVLLLLVWDVHSTVFVPTGSAGPVTRRVYAYSWRLWLWLAGSGPRGPLRLARLGPLLVPLTVLVWIALLQCGLTLLILPDAADFAVHGSDPDRFSGWTKALYVATYSLTTLGVGDIVPSGMYGRLLIGAGAAGGFVLFTVSLSYLLSVYGALGRATSLAMTITYFTGRDPQAHPAQALRAALAHGEEEQLRAWLAGLASEFSGVVIAKEQYPLISYFYSERERALPIAITQLLELITVMTALLEPSRYDSLINSPFVHRTRTLAYDYFNVLLPGTVDPRGRADEQQLRASRELGFELAWQALSDARIPLRDREAAWQAYQAARATWDAQGMAVLQHLRYALQESGS